MDDLNETYEVKEGLLSVNGRLVPLSRGVITVALLRAGWKGAEGTLSLQMARKALALDPRVGFLARQLLGLPRAKAS